MAFILRKSPAVPVNSNSARCPPLGAQSLITGQLNTRTGSGWTFGGGTEVALDARWSAKLELLWVRSGTSLANPISLFNTGFTTQFKDQFVIVRAGLNYALN